MKKIDKIINYFRNLKEEGPTNSTGPAIATFDPILGMRKRKNNEVDLRTIDSKLRRWVKSIKNK